MSVQFGHFSVPEVREQSFNRARRFSWLPGSWAAYPVIGILGSNVSDGLEADSRLT